MQLLFWQKFNQSQLLLITVAFDFVTLQLCRNNPAHLVSCWAGWVPSSPWLQVHPSADIRQDRTSSNLQEKLEGVGGGAHSTP